MIRTTHTEDTTMSTKTANDNDVPPRIGDRVELPGMCCPGARDRVGTIADIEDSRWGRSYRVALDEGGDEWVKRVEHRDARGAGCRYL